MICLLDIAGHARQRKDYLITLVCFLLLNRTVSEISSQNNIFEKEGKITLNIIEIKKWHVYSNSTTVC